MGTPPGESPGSGFCHECEGVLWAENKSPRYYQVTITGVQLCPLFPPPVPNGTFILHKRDGRPCEWWDPVSPVGFIRLIVGDLATSLYVQSVLFWDLFSAAEGPCASGGNNNLTCQVPSSCFGGSATWTPYVDAVPELLLKDYNLFDMPETFYNLHFTPGEVAVYSFNNLVHKTNIKVKYSP